MPLGNGSLGVLKSGLPVRALLVLGQLFPPVVDEISWGCTVASRMVCYCTSCTCLVGQGHGKLQPSPRCRRAMYSSPKARAWGEGRGLHHLQVGGFPWSDLQALMFPDLIFSRGDGVRKPFSLLAGFRKRCFAFSMQLPAKDRQELPPDLVREDEGMSNTKMGWKREGTGPVVMVPSSKVPSSD